MNWKRITTYLLLAATFFVLHTRSLRDRTPWSAPLSGLPRTMDGLTSEDLVIPAETLAVLGDGRFLNRVYTGPSAAAPIGLFLAYFPSQRNGQSIHSPQNCLPGAGWTFDSESPLHFTDSAGAEHAVGEYVITNGSSRQIVLYWYRSRGRDVMSDFRAKAYLIEDSIRYNRTDGALIRIATPVLNEAELPAARNRVLQFARELTPLLPQYIPS